MKNKEVAIIGVGLNLPMAKTKEEYWENIKSGVYSIKDLPKNRKLDYDLFYKYNNYLPYYKKEYLKMGYLDEIDKFDYKFFGMTKLEARVMCPVHRLWLKTSWHALEDAGYSKSDLNNKKVGIFLGIDDDYKFKDQVIRIESANTIKVALLGSHPPMAANRLSYFLNTKGPCVAIDTACSSSLTAIHYACESLYNKECDIAVAGGAHLVNFKAAKQHSGLGIENTDQIYRVFDENSNGFIEGEGAAAVVLKSLNKAVKDNDNIQAKIVCSNINSNGRSSTVVATDSESQIDLLTNAWRRNKINPEDIVYFEAHGTGTKVGDPREIEAINKSFKEFTPKKRICAVGSGKANIGHLFHTAGVAGLIKCVLLLKNREMPHIINLEKVNENIRMEDSAIYLNTKSEKINNKRKSLKCAINSFGISGTNCHMVIANWDSFNNKKTRNKDRGRLLFVSAMSKDQLLMLIKSYKDFILNNDVNLDDFCFTANVGRDKYKNIVIILFENKEDLISKFTKIINSFDLESKYKKVFYFSKGNKNNLEVFCNTDTLGKNNSEIKDANQLLLKYINNKKNINNLIDVVKLYVSDTDIDWGKMYKKNCKRISIPLYPYAENRCWLEPRLN